MMGRITTARPLVRLRRDKDRDESRASLAGRHWRSRGARGVAMKAGIVSLAGLTGLFLAAGPASAQALAFTGNASGQALQITIAGTQLTGGTSSATWDGTTATATGAGEVLPVLVSNATTSATSTSGPESAPETCTVPPAPGIPAPLNELLNLGVACGSASSDVASGLPSATATGTAANVSVGLEPILKQVVSPSNPLVGVLQQVLGKLPALPAGGSSLGSIIQQILGSTLSNPLVSVVAGGSTSSLSPVSGAEVATSTTKGASVDLLPGAGNAGAPLIGIDVGEATATASDTAGTFTSSDTPATVAIHLNIPGNPQTINLAPGQSITLLAGTPLQTTIVAGDGSNSSTASSATAEAQALSVDLAQGLGASSLTAENGGILVHLANASATLAAGPSTVPASTTSQSSTPASAPVSTQSVSSPAPAAEVAATPTAVHTGEWWAGSLPAVGALMAVGSGLLGWPRLRRSALAGLGHIRHGRG